MAKPLSVGVKAALIGGCAVIIAAIISILVRNQSVAVHVNQSPKASVKNNSENTTFNNQGNAMYQAGTNNQIFNLSNTASNVQSMLFAPNGVPISASTIGNVNVYLGGNGENTQTEAEIAQLRHDLDNESKVTTQDILALTKLVSELDNRTKDIHRISDGRTSIGGVIAVGSIDNSEYTNGLAAFNRGEYYLALNCFKKTIEMFESAPTNWLKGFEIVHYNPVNESQVYELAAISALRLQSNDVLNTYAENAVNFNATPETENILVRLQMYLGALALQNRDYSNSFVILNAAITNYEYYSITTNLIDEKTSLELYRVFGTAASILGKTNEESKAAQKISAMSNK